MFYNIFQVIAILEVSEASLAEGVLSSEVEDLGGQDPHSYLEDNLSNKIGFNLWSCSRIYIWKYLVLFDTLHPFFYGHF